MSFFFLIALLNFTVHKPLFAGPENSEKSKNSLHNKVHTCRCNPRKTKTAERGIGSRMLKYDWKTKVAILKVDKTGKVTTAVLQFPRHRWPSFIGRAA